MEFQSPAYQSPSSGSCNFALHRREAGKVCDCLITSCDRQTDITGEALRIFGPSFLASVCPFVEMHPNSYFHKVPQLAPSSDSVHTAACLSF